MIFRVSKKWLKNLVVICLFIIIFCCRSLSPQTSQPKQTNLLASNTSSPEVSQSMSVTKISSSPTLVTSPKLEDVSISSSSQLILSAVTLEEVQLREQQVQIAKEIEKYTRIQMQAGLATSINVLKAVYFRLDNEIQLLQAKQLLSKQQQGETKN